MNENNDTGWTDEPARRRERGIAAYARIFDVPEKDVPAAMADRVGPVFAEEAFMSAGGPAWSHPALTDRERSIVIITALAAQGATGDRLDGHIRLAQRNGLDYEALTAMMTLMTNYIGYAHGSQAMEAVERIAG
ncbi:carboxymuconolactone decarboxylase family protein [Streptomyces hokutonensis]|uniref:carboxymuconolactone decarboxylase family protein n=1 Tax=Streptomyces hokutonensis TaxID=1306990 RepID=UPI00380F9F8D